MEKIVYAIIDAKERLPESVEFVKGIEGLTGTPVYLLRLNDIAVAVSDFSEPKYIINKELALQYAGVIEKLWRQSDLLPVRYGTFLKSDELIHELMLNHYSPMLGNLQKVCGKAEFGLKILWDYEKNCSEIKTRLDAEAEDSGNYFPKETIYSNYLMVKVKKHKLEAAVMKQADELIEMINIRLGKINPVCKFKKMVTNTILLDAVFLIENSNRAVFIEAMEILKQENPGFSLLLTGPWPPYSFVDVRIDG